MTLHNHKAAVLAGAPQTEVSRSWLPSLYLALWALQDPWGDGRRTGARLPICCSPGGDRPASPKQLMEVSQLLRLCEARGWGALPAEDLLLYLKRLEHSGYGPGKRGGRHGAGRDTEWGWRILHSLSFTGKK